jgi:hypothetical protein
MGWCAHFSRLVFAIPLPCNSSQQKTTQYAPIAETFGADAWQLDNSVTILTSEVLRLLFPGDDAGF